MGGEFIPSLDEGDVAVQALRVPGTSLSQSVEMQAALEKRLPADPRGQGGLRADRDRRGGDRPHAAVDLRWLRDAQAARAMARPREDGNTVLVTEIEKASEEIAGSNYELSQPIQLRFNELISGVRSNVGVKIFGDDLDTLIAMAGQVQSVLQTIPGAADVKTEQVAGLPVLTIRLNRAALSRLGLSVAEVQGIVEIAVGGKNAGPGVRGRPSFRAGGAAARAPALGPRGDQIAADSTAGARKANRRRFALYGGPRHSPRSATRRCHRSPVSMSTPGPNQISREDGKRRIVVSANVRERDLGSFVADLQRQIAEKVKLPAGYWIGWGGQFEQLVSATKRLTIVVPIALLLIFLLLFMSLGYTADAALVFSGVPLALTGGIAALLLRGIPLSISAGIGFIALSGVAVLNGLVIIAFIQRLRAEGRALVDAVREGALTRLRPVLMTALVASLGFVPMAIATGAGAEVQRPLATVVIGGIISSTILTLLVLPALYVMFRREADQSITAEPAATPSQQGEPA